ncbi:unnamed protein product, partial [Discosporangium mesarthrocarpum]
AVRTGQEVLRGHTVMDAPSGSGGLYAVFGPGDIVQVHCRGKLSVESGQVAEMELFRLDSGGSETGEVAFSASGEFFLTRNTVKCTACLWSVRPAPFLLKSFEGVCCSITPEAFLSGGKAVVLGHGDCTVRVYSCDTGKVLVSRSVAAPAVCVAAIRARGNAPALLAAAGGVISRWPLPPILTLGGHCPASSA